MRTFDYLQAANEVRRGWLARWQAGEVRCAKTPRLGPRNIVQVARGGILEIRGELRTCRDVEIVVYPGGHLVLGDRLWIGHGTTIACASSIRIGAETMLGDLVSVRDMNHRRQPGVPLRASGLETRPIEIGDDCWLGSKVTVAAGARLGRGVTVGANAVVAGEFGDGVTIGGVPARILE